MGNTVKLHRVIKAPIERLYRAFLTPAALVKWFPPHGFVCDIHEFNATEGGKFHMSFINFTTGSQHSFGGKYLTLIPNELICHSDQFDNPALPSAMTTTIMFKSVFCGTEIHIVQENIPELIPIHGCYLGWQESLTLLTQLVEPSITD